MFPETVGTTVQREFHRAVADKVAVEFENYYEPWNRWFEVKAYPSKDGGLSAYFRDITARKQAEERERQLAAETAVATAKFRAVFDQSGVFAGIMTLDGIVIEANRLCLEACGFRREEVIGRSFWECGWWSASEEVRAKIQAGTVLATQGTPYREVLPYVWADGTERVVDFALHPIRDETGRVVFLHPTGVDITEVKRAQQEREQLLEKLRDADHRKDEFLAMLAHELRNPLAAIGNAVAFAVRVEHGDHLTWAINIITRQLKHLTRLIDDLLDISRISRGKIELRRDILDVAPSLDAADRDRAETHRGTKAYAPHGDQPGKSVGGRGPDAARASGRKPAHQCRQVQRQRRGDLAFGKPRGQRDCHPGQG